MSYHAFAVVMVVMWSIMLALAVAQLWLSIKKSGRRR